MMRSRVRLTSAPLEGKTPAFAGVFSYYHHSRLGQRQHELKDRRRFQSQRGRDGELRRPTEGCSGSRCSSGVVGRSAPRTSRAGSSVVRLRFSAPLCSSSFPSVRHAVHLYEIAGARKTTLARYVAWMRKALHLRIDTFEQALRDTGATLDRPEGYMAACRVAADNLRLGCDVVADSVNPLDITRSAWREVAITPRFDLSRSR